MDARAYMSQFPLLISATADDAGKRLDQFLAAQLHETSRARVQQLISQDLVLVNDVTAKASLRLRGGERIAVLAAAERRHCGRLRRTSRSTSSTKMRTWR